MKYRWGIIGAGWIATDMSEALKKVNGEIYAIASRTTEKAKALADKFGIKIVYPDVEALFNDDKVDIVYIATPHNTHYELMKAAVLAGKHVLCEKAITVNARQLEEVLEIAREKKLLVAEAMTIYHMPLYRELKRRMEDGSIGPIKMIQVNFGSLKDNDESKRFFSPELAGGALLDIGVYALSFVRWFLKEQPSSIMTTVQMFKTGVDEQSGIIIKNNSGQMAVVSLSFRAKQPKTGVVAGEWGYIEIPNYPRAQSATITFPDGTEEKISCGDTAEALPYEVCAFQEALDSGDHNLETELTLDVMRLMDKIRGEWGMSYPFE